MVPKEILLDIPLSLLANCWIDPWPRPLAAFKKFPELIWKSAWAKGLFNQQFGVVPAFWMPRARTWALTALAGFSTGALSCSHTSFSSRDTVWESSRPKAENQSLSGTLAG